MKNRILRISLLVTVFLYLGAVSPSLAQVTDGFVANPPMFQARYYHTATLLADGRILITGGSSSVGGAALATAEVYNPTTGRFQTTGTMNVARIGHSATRLNDGRVLIVGGTATNGSNTAEVYNPTGNLAGTFTYTGPTVKNRTGHSATLLSNGQVLIAGGGDPRDPTHLPNKGELFTPSANAFTETTGSMISPRTLPSASRLPDGRVLLAGGDGWTTSTNPFTHLTLDVSMPLFTTELYNPSTQTFTSGPNMSSVRVAPSSTSLLLNNGKTLLVGTGEASFQPPTAQVFNPLNNTLSAPIALHQDINTNGDVGSAGHKAAILANGNVLITGGATYSNLTAAELLNPFIVSTLPYAFIYNPTAQTFTRYTADLARASHTMTSLPNCKVLITGGAVAGGSVTNSTVIFQYSGCLSPAPTATPYL